MQPSWRYEKNVMRDVGAILVSILIAVLLVKTGVLEKIIAAVPGSILPSFLAGLFFTSIFTTAPAIATLGTLALSRPIMEVALVGAVGAVLGDLVLFVFLRNHVAEDIAHLLGKRGRERWKALWRLKALRWLAPFLGALIIASPLPDELGIALMGISKMRTHTFIPLSFFMNAVGIIIIGLVAQLYGIQKY